MLICNNKSILPISRILLNQFVPGRLNRAVCAPASGLHCLPLKFQNFTYTITTCQAILRAGASLFNKIAGLGDSV